MLPLLSFIMLSPYSVEALQMPVFTHNRCVSKGSLAHSLLSAPLAASLCSLCHRSVEVHDYVWLYYVHAVNTIIGNNRDGGCP